MELGIIVRIKIYRKQVLYFGNVQCFSYKLQFFKTCQQWLPPTTSRIMAVAIVLLQVLNKTYTPLLVFASINKNLYINKGNLTKPKRSYITF